MIKNRTSIMSQLAAGITALLTQATNRAEKADNSDINPKSGPIVGTVKNGEEYIRTNNAVARLWYQQQATASEIQELWDALNQLSDYDGYLDSHGAEPVALEIDPGLVKYIGHLAKLSLMRLATRDLRESLETNEFEQELRSLYGLASPQDHAECDAAQAQEAQSHGQAQDDPALVVMELDMDTPEGRQMLSDILGANLDTALPDMPIGFVGDKLIQSNTSPSAADEVQAAYQDALNQAAAFIGSVNDGTAGGGDAYVLDQLRNDPKVHNLAHAIGESVAA